MPAEPNPIEAILADRGPVSFRDFMELALYHREHGYYGSGRAALGRQGDYFTNVSVGPLFGRLLAWQFAEMWRLAGSPAAFTIIEQGANDGAFAADVLTWLREHQPQFHNHLHYQIIEPLPVLEARQREHLHDFAGKVTWHDSLEKLPRITGVFFSNELVDAFPVHLVRYRGDQWHELWVTPDLEWEERPLPENLAAQIADLPRIENYTTEINLAAIDWAAKIAAKLDRGWIVTVDYGYPRDIYYAPERHTGTLLCYAGHTRSSDPLENPGAWDITAHVDFTTLAPAFLNAPGIELTGFTDQHHFLAGIAAQAIPEGTTDPAILRPLKTLLHPEMLGRTFQVLTLSRGVPSTPLLAGLRFARNARRQLGLPETD
jgi:SAM-dependent MidA family methyltransferase